MIRGGPGFGRTRSLCCLLAAALFMVPGALVLPGAPIYAKAETVWWTNTSSDFNTSGSYLTNCVINGTGAGARLELARVSDWIQIGGTGPSAREAAAMSAIGTDGKLVLFGGYGRTSGMMNDTWVYDLESMKWTKKTPADTPPARDGHAMASVFNDDKVVMFGGWDSTLRDGRNDTWVYDLSDDQWSLNTPQTSPPGRDWAAAAAACNDDKMVIFGGQNTSVVFNDTWIYDIGDNNCTRIFPANSPLARHYASQASFSSDDKVLMFGGQAMYGGPLGDTWIFNFTDRQWYRKDPIAPPAARGGSGAAAILDDDKVLLFGGTANSYSETWIYDLSEDSWRLQHLGHQPPTRSNMAISTPLKTDKIIIFGGSFSSEFSDTWMYYPSGYSVSGDYTSAPFDTGGESNYYSLNWTASVPPGTGMRFQLRAADTAGNLSSANFSGPSGSAGSYYTENSTIYYGHYGQRWVQYRAFLNTSDIDVTPSIDDVLISYNRFPFAPNLLSPANGIWINTTYPNFTWAFTDTDSASQGGYEWQAGRSPVPSSMNLTSDEESSNLTYYQYEDPMSEGIWYWRVRTRDAEGDWGPLSECFRVGVDTAPPWPFAPYAVPDRWTTDRVNVWFNTSDNRSGIENYTLWIDGKQWGIQESPFQIPQSVPDGIHTVLVRAYDRAGNHAEGKVKVFIDRTPPEPFTPSASLCWTRSDPVIEFETKDKASGMDHFEVKVDLDQFLRQKSPLALTGPMGMDLEDGAHDVLVRAYDVAGNFREASLTVYVDKTPPEQFQLAISPAGWSAADPIVTFSAFEAASEIDHYEVMLDSGAFMNQTSPLIPFNLTDGIHSITVRAIDLAGNFVEGTGHLYIDRTPPNGFSPAAKPSDWTRADPVVTFDTIDESSGIKGYMSRVDDDLFSKANSPYTLMQLPDGRHLVTVRAFDNAGNFVDGTVDVYIDRQPPTGASVIINSGGESTGQRQVRLAVFAQDIESGLDMMCFSPDGVDYTGWEPFDLNKSWTVSPGKGDKTVYMKVKDRAGNEARAASATIMYLPSEKGSLVPLPVFVALGMGIAAAVGLTIWLYLKVKAPPRLPGHGTTRP
jgi:N-acetylneuraminic acid mutarotase